MNKQINEQIDNKYNNLKINYSCVEGSIMNNDEKDNDSDDNN